MSSRPLSPRPLPMSLVPNPSLQLVWDISQTHLRRLLSEALLYHQVKDDASIVRCNLQVWNLKEPCNTTEGCNEDPHTAVSAADFECPFTKAYLVPSFYCALGPTLAASTKLMCIFNSTTKSMQSAALFLKMGKWLWHFPQPRFQAVGLARWSVKLKNQRVKTW